jgi:NAD(P) transhydrogenase subunit beta
MKVARRASAAENELFVDPKTSMVFGGAKQSLVILGMEVKAARGE